MEGADNEHEGNPDLKEKDAVVQTTITLEHLKTNPTELLANANSQHTEIYVFRKCC
jgi:hypothetical protein